MYRTCIVIADASRARLFTHERTAQVEGLNEQLVEVCDLINPARRLRPSQLFSDTPGSNRTSGLQYGVDDHRDGHIAELDAEFAREVVTAVATQLRAAPAKRLVLCASPRMLGEIREAIGELREAPPIIDELPRNFVKLTPSRLRDHLVSHGMLPPVLSRA